VNQKLKIKIGKDLLLALNSKTNVRVKWCSELTTRIDESELSTRNLANLAPVFLVRT